MKTIRRVISRISIPIESILLASLFIFIVINWVLLAFAEKIGPPDFYKLYGVAETIFSGDLKVGIIPPLFPVLMYPLGKLLGIFLDTKEAFILAGRLIALAASLGTLWFSYLILKRISGKWAYVGLSFLAISPWFLKLISFPITDMLYLFFVTATFFTFLKQSPLRFSLPAVLGGVLTRFEGVLLIFSGIVNYFKLRKRYVYLLLVLLPAVLLLFLFFMPRIFLHLKDIILPQKSYLSIFQHPMEFFNIFYGNLLFFIPIKFPYAVKLAALLLLFVFFLYGAFRLYKINKLFTLSILIYEFLFVVAKGYIDTTDPGREFRRVFSGLWIFYIICFIGCYFLLKRIRSNRIMNYISMVIGGLFFAVIIFSLEPIKFPYLLLSLLWIPPCLYSLRSLDLKKIPKLLAIVLLLVFGFQIYQLSFAKAEHYVISYANKTPYAAAQWLSFSRLKENPVILSYTDNNMLGYYLIEEKTAGKNINWTEFTVPLRYTEENREQYKAFFFKELKTRGVDYIIFDNYVVQQPEFLGINDVKRLLFEERENQDYFRLKNLYYKGKNVGYILRPVSNR